MNDPQVDGNQTTGDPLQNSWPVSATPILPTRSDDHQVDVVDERALAIQVPRKAGKPWAWSVAGAVMISLLVFAAVRFLGDAAEAEEVETGPVATSEIQVRDLAESQEYTGQLQYDDAIPVAASGSGYLTGLVEDGDTIERGDVVYRLSNDPGEAELLTAEQQVASAVSQLAYLAQGIEVEKVEVPTLIVHGRQDRVLPIGNGIELAGRISTSRLIQIDGLGHLVQMERPDIFNPIATAFWWGLQANL